MANPASTFRTTVRDALKHYTDPEWLGQHSALATPYFLGSALWQVEQPSTAAGRGEALRQVLFAAAAAAWPGDMPSSRAALLEAVEAERAAIGNGGPCYLYLVLELRYLRHYFSPRTPPTAVGAMHDFLNVSESAFFRHLAQAQDALAVALLAQIRPNLRLEQPVLTANLAGRDPLIAACLDDLQAKRSVALSGMGGIGKTSLGTAVKQRWPSRSVFWYTIRPGLNDDLTSLLFSLGHFLHTWDRSSLWQQLIAGGGTVDDMQRALGFLHQDLSQPGPLPLLCFDEIDLLHTGTSQPRHGVHKQLLELFEGLRTLAPVLFIGQRALIDTETHYALQPLTVADVGQLLDDRGLSGSAQTARQVHRLTHGNPRLIELLLASGAGEELTLQGEPAARPLFNRLWRRLNSSEKRVLGGLAVFRSFAPEDIWLHEPGLEALRQRHLLKADAAGAVALLPFFRELTYGELNDAQRQELHAQAATIRATRGQHTEAAHHYIQAGDAAAAVAVWFANQDVEIEQGKAGAAHALFSAIAPDALKGRPARQLKVIQNRLHLLQGRAEAVLANMSSYSWHVEEELTAEAYRQWSEALWQGGDIDAARERLDDAAGVLARLSQRTVQVLTRRGAHFLGDNDFGAARHEADLAQYEVEWLRAAIGTTSGNLTEAQAHLQKALTLAEAAGDERRQARAHYLLAVAAGNLGDLPAAHGHAAAAMDYYRHIGDRLNLEGMRAELAGFYLNVGQFEQVIEPGERALRFFERVNHQTWIMHLSSNLAEAYYETGDLDKAEQYALRARAFESPRIYPYVSYTLGLIYQARQDPTTAAHSFQTGIAVAEETGDRFIAAYLQRAYGSFLIELGRHNDGLAALTTAYQGFVEMAIAHEIKKTEQILQSHSLTSGERASID